MKISSSTLVNIILASILLTSMFFISLTSSVGQYDPWLDYNEDGYINAKDAIQLGVAFDTQGDPTKNVNVTNFPLDGEGNIKVSFQDGGTPVLMTSAQRIVLLESFAHTNLGGVWIRADMPAASFFFSFDPEPTFQNLTGFHVNIVLFGRFIGNETFNFEIDDSTVLSGNLSVWTAIRAHCLEWNTLDLNPGMHKIELYPAAGSDFWILRLELLIEYKHIA